MKAKRLFRQAILLTTVISASYWFGYRHGIAERPGKLNDVSQLRQIGMSFRGARNDVSRFEAVEQIQPAKDPEQGK